MKITGGISSKYTFIPPSSGNLNDRIWIRNSYPASSSSSSSESRVSSPTSSDSSTSPVHPHEFLLDSCHGKPQDLCHRDAECRWDGDACVEKIDAPPTHLPEQNLIDAQEEKEERLLESLCQGLGCSKGQMLKDCNNFRKYTPRNDDERLFLSEHSDDMCEKSALRRFNVGNMARVGIVGHFVVGFANNLFGKPSPPFQPRGGIRPTMSPLEIDANKNENGDFNHKKRMVWKNKLKRYEWNVKS